MHELRAYLCRLAAFCLVWWFAGGLNAAEIVGKVGAVQDRELIVVYNSPIKPKVGDKFTVLVDVPNVGQAQIAEGRVIRVEAELLTARIEQSTGAVAFGHQVRIQTEGAPPAEAPAAGQKPPAAAPTAPPVAAQAPASEAKPAAPLELGLKLELLNDQLRQLFDLDEASGLFVASVEKNSLGEQGGLRKRDVILSVDGLPLKTLDGWQQAILKPPGTKLKLELQREGKRQSIDFPLGIPPASWLGTQLQTRTDGVEVMLVLPAGPADRAGVKAGDVITALDGDTSAVQTVQVFVSRVSKLASPAEVKLTWRRDGDVMTRPVMLELRPPLDQLVVRAREGAQAGLADAQLMWGEYLLNGAGVEANPAEAIVWLRKAADQGQRQAQVLLGQYYLNGTGVKADVAEGVGWLLKSAQRGSGGAAYQLGLLYLRGEGVIAANPAESVRWLRQASEQGNVEATSELAVALYNGTGVPQDRQAAIRNLRLAGEHGSLLSQTNLAICTIFGEGIEANQTEGLKSLRTLAEGGYSYAMYRLGVVLLGGLTGDDGKKEGFDWLLKGANAGHSEAQFSLGQYYFEGNQTPRNEQEARHWWTKAAELGHTKAKERLASLTASTSTPAVSQPVGTPQGDLGQVARQAQQALVWLVNPQRGRGTGFVISRKHRLVATNAHVADLMFGGGKLTAVLNEQGTKYEVAQAWFHPGTLRTADATRSALLRSMDPAVGAVFPICADVALLRLSGDGPELPHELTLAQPQEIENLLGQAIGLLGYPFYDTTGSASDVARPQATYQQGVINRLTDFNMSSSDPRHRQYVQHSATALNGASGSPIFLGNGRVVAVHNSGRMEELNRNFAQLTYGIRVDCLWELIAFHRLEDRLALPVDRGTLDLERFDRPDPNLDKYAEIWRLLREADVLIHQQRHAEAAEKCNQAVKLNIDYPYSYAVRQEVLVSYASTYEDRLTIAQLQEQTDLALKDARKFAELLPGLPMAELRVALALNNCGAVTSKRARSDAAGRTNYQETVRICTELLNEGELNSLETAEAYSTRGMARLGLHEFNGALADANEAIRLQPENYICYQNRAKIHQGRGDARSAQADRQKAEQLREKLVRGQ